MKRTLLTLFTPLALVLFFSTFGFALQKRVYFSEIRVVSTCGTGNIYNRLNDSQNRSCLEGEDCIEVKLQLTWVGGFSPQAYCVVEGSGDIEPGAFPANIQNAKFLGYQTTSENTNELADVAISNEGEVPSSFNFEFHISNGLDFRNQNDYFLLSYEENLCAEASCGGDSTCDENTGECVCPEGTVYFPDQNDCLPEADNPPPGAQGPLPPGMDDGDGGTGGGQTSSSEGGGFFCQLNPNASAESFNFGLAWLLLVGLGLVGLRSVSKRRTK